MKVLGVDNGRRTGIGVVEDSKFIEASYFITGEKSTSNVEKIRNHFNLLRSVILRTAPNLIVVESPNDLTGINKVLLSRAYYTNTIILAGQYNIPIKSCHAMTLKKAVAGRGNLEKVNVCDTLVKRYSVPRERIEIPVFYKTKKDSNGNLKIKDYLYDETDATALAFYPFVIDNFEGE
jgi:Holliday junction resolvasome RuvABC endonuclease subunit